jgi:hypothetical protein
VCADKLKTFLTLLLRATEAGRVSWTSADGVLSTAVGGTELIVRPVGHEYEVVVFAADGVNTVFDYRADPGADPLPMRVYQQAAIGGAAARAAALDRMIAALCPAAAAGAPE